MKFLFEDHDASPCPVHLPSSLGQALTPVADETNKIHRRYVNLKHEILNTASSSAMIIDCDENSEGKMVDP